MLEILIADDHPVVRSGIRNLFRNDTTMRVAAEASCAAELLQQVGRRTFGALLLDFGLPDANGLEIIPVIRARHASVPIVVFSNAIGVDEACRKAGAAAFVGKEATFDDLKAAIQSVIGTSAPEAAGLPPPPPPHLHLSRRELDVMLGLVRGRRPKAIALEMGISQKTVATHRTRLMRKLNVDDNRGLLLYALRAGMTDWS